MRHDQESRPGHEQELVALNGHDSVVDEVVRLRREVARLRDELDAERTSSAAIHAQLAVLSRQLDATQVQAPRRLLRRKR